ncbi:hypothetical protein R3W88_031839 [Solanum pinnatisectum]|uniref:Uncharacterized protein n=1 Tax=Solanum pinnatisectum TaxID=50273 RepID=A0AAV9LMH4_9SOLN|nr:hypothetical protein R3W88_031839 [Solanum pinnatisectum]
MCHDLDSLKRYLASFIYDSSLFSMTSLPFLVLITELCERVEVPFRGKIDVRITPSASSDIQKIHVDYLWDDVAQKKPPPTDMMSVVYPTTLVIETRTLSPSLE